MVACAALALAGCGGTVDASRCGPSGPATVLSDRQRVMPVVASNGGTDTVAAWQTTTGAPVEVRTRKDAGAWAPVRQIGGRNSRDPDVAMTPQGTAFVALETYDPSHRARIGVVSDGDGWASMTYISPETFAARRPRIAFDRAGRGIAVWQIDASGTSTEIQMSERSPDGTWSAPRTLSAVGRQGTPQLAVAPDGSAVVAWHGQSNRRAQIWATSRSATGEWSDATPVSPEVHHAVDPGVAAFASGTAAVGWVQSARGGPAIVSVARRVDDAWDTPTIVTTMDETAREMSRPGRAEMAPGLVFVPDGRLTISWAAGRDDTTEVATATMNAAGRFTPIHRLSRPGQQAGGVTLGRAPGGTTITGWEEIDGGLLRVRVATDGGTCHDIAPPDGESAGIRIAGGTAPVAVYIDLNRGRIMGSDL